MLERIGARLARSVLFWDLFLTVIALRIAASVRLRVELGSDIGAYRVQLPWQLYAAVAGIWLTIFLLLTPQRAIFQQGLLEAIGRLVAAVALASLAFAGLLYLSVRDVSRLQFLYFVAIDLAILVLFHIAVRTYIRLRQRNGVSRRVLIVGGNGPGYQLVQEFRRQPWAGLHVVGYVGDEPLGDLDVPSLGPLTDKTIVDVVDRHQIDEVIFALPPQQYDVVAQTSIKLLERPVMVHLIPGILDLAFLRATVDLVGGVPLISLRESVLTEPQRVMKRLFDITASSLLLVLLAPVMLLIALAIKLDSPGPVLFAQERIGENGRRFRMLKFRSMYQDAEQRWHEVARRASDGRLLHKTDDDPRITPFGRKLRRASLDELPQLLNVLRGDMSLVGPRPEMPYIAREYEPWQWQRFSVPPGMTGWWQVNGRADKMMHLHTEDDLYYIQNYSFWLDLKILWKTIGTVLRGQGAY